MTMNTTTADRLLDSVLDFIANAPDEEFLAYLADTGRDTHALSAIGRAGIASALKKHGVQKRLAAKAQHLESKAAYERARAALPRTLSEKMALLARLLQDSTAAGLRTSLAHRDLTSVPEPELDSILLQLIQLTSKKE